MDKGGAGPEKKREKMAVSINRPKLACRNLIPDISRLKQFVLDYGFDGVDWNFTREELPRRPQEESSLVQTISSLSPLEVRYHCGFWKTDLGDVDPDKAKEAMNVFRYVCRLVSKLGGRFLTIHVGLGRNSTTRLSWNRTVEGLASLVQFASGLGVRICLENLAWGWTSRPELFEKLIRKSAAWATLDIGHAQVSPSVTTQHYQIQDFVMPHPERFLSAHVYHEEKEGHLAPLSTKDIEDRLNLLLQLPLCEWWVLELHHEKPLLDTLAVVREYLEQKAKSDEKPEDTVTRGGYPKEKSFSATNV